MSALALATTALAAPATDDVVEATVDLTPAEARVLTDGIRRDLDAAATALRAAYAGRAWIALGHATWETYIDVELGGALQGLVAAVRNEVIGVLKDSGFSNRAIAASVGLKSDEPVRRALKLVRPDGVTGPSVGRDGKVYVRSAAAAQAVAAARPMLALPGPRKQDTALDLLELAGPDGLTITELQRKKRWTYSQASACLSRLNSAREQYDGGRRRRIERLANRRDGYGVYVLPEYVSTRDVLAPGQRLPRSTKR